MGARGKPGKAFPELCRVRGAMVRRANAAHGSRADLRADARSTANSRSIEDRATACRLLVAAYGQPLSARRPPRGAPGRGLRTGSRSSSSCASRRSPARRTTATGRPRCSPGTERPSSEGRLGGCTTSRPCSSRFPTVRRWSCRCRSPSSYAALRHILVNMSSRMESAGRRELFRARSVSWTITSQRSSSRGLNAFSFCACSRARNAG